MLRLCGAELVEVPALPYSNPNNYQHVGNGSPISCAKASRTACCSPTSGTTWTTPRRITNRPVLKSGNRPAARSTASSVGRNRRHAGRHQPLSEGKEQGHRHRLRRSARRRCRAVQPGHAKSTPGRSISEGIGLGRVTPVIETAKVDNAFLVRMRKRSTVILRPAESTRACVSAARRVSTSPAPSGSPSSSAPARPSYGPLRLPATAISRSCSILISCGAKKLPVPEMAGEAHQDRRAVREGVMVISQDGSKGRRRNFRHDRRRKRSGVGYASLTHPTAPRQNHRKIWLRNSFVRACCGLAKNSCGVFAR